MHPVRHNRPSGVAAKNRIQNDNANVDLAAKYSAGQVAVTLPPASQRGKLVLSDACGRIVAQANVTQGKDASVSIDTEKLAKGVYFVNYADANSSQSIKMHVAQ